MILSAVFASGGENVNFLTQMHTKCVLKYQKSTHCIPNLNFADLFGTTGSLLKLGFLINNNTNKDFNNKNNNKK